MEARIFANRSLRFDKIKCVGFDMDATLAIYKTPVCEELAFDLAVQRLVFLGYPPDIGAAPYRKEAIIRNTWYDKKYGNLLKTDEHCNILSAFRGFRKLKGKEVRQYYRNKHIALERARIFVLNTVFNVPETFLLSAVVDYFERRVGAEYEGLNDKIGYKKINGEQIVLFSTIFEDCRNAIDWIHTHGVFKNEITGNLKRYIAQDSRAAAMFHKLSQGGKKTFLLTNSDWIYTDLVMSHVMGSQWRQLFDVVIVDGEKPKWFLSDSAFKTVDVSTGCAQMGSHSGPLQKNDVYCKGCATEFVQRMGLAGKDILYVGDHIFGDVLKSKKVDGWRTLLIVPELGTELKIWSQQQPKFHKLVELHQNLSLDLGEEDRKNILKQISKISNDMESEYGSMGSMLRCGWRQTYFAGQLEKYADLYTGNVYNLYGYSCAHYFNSPIQLLPHEEKIIRGITPVMMGLPHEERIPGLLSEVSDLPSEREQEDETENDSACCGCCRIRKN
ncbi:unnamed protein product [Cylicocyclus nassatus]|uniref:Uncharacterized protein n=1 Tax=Cylicocyclus nassatus TaxID=53992 RepID=A0AA36DMM7_CYLNA|nr:unnamed protein product [Cylicocyclus nassatus]